MPQTFEQIEVRVVKEHNVTLGQFAAQVTIRLSQEMQRLQGARLHEVVLVFERPITS